MGAALPGDCKSRQPHLNASGGILRQLVIVQEIGDRRGEGNALANLGLAYETLSDVARARELWAAALAIYEAIESPYAARVREWLAK